MVKRKVYLKRKVYHRRSRTHVGTSDVAKCGEVYPQINFSVIPRRAWVRLNGLRTRAFPLFLVQMGMASSAACECGEEVQTVDHVVLQCPIHRPPYGSHGLTVLDDETIEWLLNTCHEISCDQAVIRRIGSKEEVLKRETCVFSSGVSIRPNKDHQSDLETSFHVGVWGSIPPAWPSKQALLDRSLNSPWCTNKLNKTTTIGKKLEALTVLVIPCAYAYATRFGY